MTRAPRHAALAALLALASGGCPRPPVSRPPYPPPSAAELLAAMKSRAARARTLRIEGKVDYLAGKGDRIKVTMSFLVERPGKLRIDADSPVGGSTVASLASDGATFQLLDVEHNRFLVGAATPCNIARLIQVRLRPEDVAEVLAGGAPLVGNATSVGWDGADGGREVLTLASPDGQGTEVIKLDAEGRSWDVRSVEMRAPDGKVVYRITHDDYHDEAGSRFPSQSHVEEPQKGTDVRIRYRSRESNVDLPGGAFHLDAPSGIAPETVSCDD